MRSFALALFVVVGCQAVDETSDDGLTLGDPPVSVEFASSFIVTDRATLDELYPAFHIGALLVAENHYLANVDGLKRHSDLEFATSAFNSASDDVDTHNAYTGLKVGTVANIVNSFWTVILPSYDPDTGEEPFHLIAVVNRLDLAGDFDMRAGGVLAGAERRWFGEGRLVYAVDRTFKGKPYPMTVIMEYRLPALKRNANGTIVLDDDFKFAVGPKSEKDWAARRQLWALVWQDLSAQPVGSRAYVMKLREIASWFAYGTSFNEHATSKHARHHLAIRSGERVQDATTTNLTNEFEYREYYLNDVTMFSTRKLRREPFACANKSSTLAARIDSEWLGTELAWNYMLGRRDLSRDEIDDLVNVCGELPYGQQDDTGEAQLRAKFARLKPDTIWAQGKVDSETEIHAFAAGTCTGCHAGETATQGFQIAPPAAGTDAVLAPFLSGPVTVAPRGTSYTYDERMRRKNLLAHFANGDTVDDDPLLRDIGCVDINKCTIE